MKSKIHTGFRAVQQAIDAAPPGAFADPALGPQPKFGQPKFGLGQSAAAPKAAVKTVKPKAKGAPFGGKAAPLFTKKTKL